MRRSVGWVLLVVVLLLGAGVAVAALNLSGKTIEIRVVDMGTASPTPARPVGTPAAPPPGTAPLPTPPASPAAASPSPALTETQTTGATPAVTTTPPASPVAVATSVQGPSATPIVIDGTPGPHPSPKPGGTPPTATPTLAPGTLVEYTIQPGDTLSGIAVRFDTTVEAIVARNHIKDSSNILWGFPLQIVVGEQTPPTALASPSTQPANPTPPAGRHGRRADPRARAHAHAHTLSPPAPSHR